MNSTWLIQRLKEPYPQDNNTAGLAEAFSFGGGFRNGGLTKDAMALLRPIFSFDYMGAAEFEFGAVPKALSKIWENRNNYAPQTFTVSGKKVYVFAPLWPELQGLLDELYDGKKQLKEWPGFRESLNGEKYLNSIIGWLELDNAFAFFKDKYAFVKFVELFRE